MSAGPTREFKLLDSAGHVMGTYTGRNPHQAAKKAASKGHSQIMLREHFGNAKYDNRVHVYNGEVQKLSTRDLSDFAIRHNMRLKPVVTKVGLLRQGFKGQPYENGPEYAAIEEKCFNSSQEDCQAPCAVNPNNGRCWYPA